MSGGVFIDGVWRSGAGERRSRSIRPPARRSGVRRPRPGRCRRRRRRRARGLPAWADQPREERIAVLRRYKDVLVERTAAFAEALSRETGKALWETKAELGSMAGKVEACRSRPMTSAPAARE
jgi:succinylglutamic semialdehyde dehydrogenase